MRTMRNMNKMDAYTLECVLAQMRTAVETAVRKAESLLNGESLKAEKEELGRYSFPTHINEAVVTVEAAKGNTLYTSDGMEKSTEDMALNEAFEALVNLMNALCRKREGEEERI